MTRPPPTVCQRGHDLTIPGARTKQGACKRCKYAATERFRQGMPATPKIVCGRKFCSVCGIWRLACFFPAVLDHRTGKVIRYSRCDTCNRLHGRQQAAAIKANPDRLANRRERHRFAQHAIRRANGVPERRWGPDNHRQPVGASSTLELVDAAPILQWLEQHTKLEVEYRLCRRAGVPVRVLHRIRNDSQPRIALAIVDRLLFAAGESPDTLDRLYPL